MKLSQRDYNVIIIEALDCLKENIQFGGETPPTIEIDNKKVKITEEMIDETIEAFNSI